MKAAGVAFLKSEPRASSSICFVLLSRLSSARLPPPGLLHFFLGRGCGFESCSPQRRGGAEESASLHRAAAAAAGVRNTQRAEEEEERRSSPTCCCG